MIVTGADHGGVELKMALVAYLRERGEEVVDLGDDGRGRGRLFDYARAVAERIGRGEAQRGILLCTNGIGMTIVANKFPAVRAALVNDAIGARMAREHNDANVLVVGGGMMEKFHAREVLRIFLDTPFAGGRHQRRVDKIAAIEGEPGMRRERGALR